MNQELPTSAQGMTLYRLHESHVIRQVLQTAMEQQAVFSLFDAQAAMAPEGHEQDVPVLAMATIAEVHAQQRSLCWQLPNQPEHLPPQLTARAYLPGGVRLQCDIAGEWAKNGAHMHLTMPWPAEVLQLQRRRHQRFALPLGQNYTASFLFGRRRCVLDIDDISAAGLALRGSRADTAMLFMGRKLSKVNLNLGEGRTISADIKVCSRRGYQSFLLGEQILVGASIIKMTDDDRFFLNEIISKEIMSPKFFDFLG